MIKTNIKMRVTPEQSKKVQEICFKNGIYWALMNYGEISKIDKAFLYITTRYDKTEDLTWSESEDVEIFNNQPNEEVDADFFIRTNGTCIEEEFTYPMWFKSRESGKVVKFMDITVGEVIEKGDGRDSVGCKSSDWVAHTYTELWEQVENPNEHLDRLDDIVDEAIKDVSKEDSHNAHYKAQKIDTITRCKANMTLDQQKAICIFNIDRYLHREKGQNLSDIQKVRYYLDWLEDIEKQLKDR